MPEEDDGLLAQAMGLLDKGSERTKRLLTAYVLGSAAWKLLRAGHSRLEEYRTYTVSISGEDDLFDDLHTWLIEHLPSQHRRSLTASTVEKRSYEDEEFGRANYRSHLHLAYDGRQNQKVSIDGHDITVTIDRKQPEVTTNSGPDSGSWVKATQSVVLTSRSVEGRDAVIRLLESLVSNEDLPARLHFATKYGWSTRYMRFARPLETVVLPAGQKERIVADVERFLTAEKRYSAMGLPWHRGYIFHGVPGTGKTSLVTALSGHFGLNVYFLALGAVEDDNALADLVKSIRPQSMLLIEDIDIIKASHQREAEGGGVTLSGLLNVLDGVVTPHGLMTFMTTNNISVLDHALLRPGRADRIEQFNLLDEDQFNRLLTAFVGHHPHIRLHKPITPSSVVEVLTEHIHQPDEMIDAIKEMINASN